MTVPPSCEFDSPVAHDAVGVEPVVSRAMQPVLKSEKLGSIGIRMSPPSTPDGAFIMKLYGFLVGSSTVVETVSFDVSMTATTPLPRALKFSSSLLHAT